MALAAYIPGAEEGAAAALAALAQADLPEALVSPVAVAGKVAYGVDESGTLAAHHLPSLSRGDPGRWQAAWRGDRAGWATACWWPRPRLRRTEPREVVLLGRAEKLLWQIDLHDGPLAGHPAVAGDDLILACVGGTFSRVQAATGKDLNKLDLGAPWPREWPCSGRLPWWPDTTALYFVNSPDQACTHSTTAHARHCQPEGGMQDGAPRFSTGHGHVGRDVPYDLQRPGRLGCRCRGGKGRCPAGKEKPAGTAAAPQAMADQARSSSKSRSIRSRSTRNRGGPCCRCGRWICPTAAFPTSPTRTTSSPCGCWTRRRKPTRSSGNTWPKWSCSSRSCWPGRRS